MILFILYLKCFAAMMIGLAVHTITKFNEAKELFDKGNVEELTFSTFLKKKMSSHILNVICSSLWLLILPYAVKQYPTVNDSEYLAAIVHILICAIAGWGGSSIALKFFGTGTKYAMDVIDKKTNIADGK